LVASAFADAKRAIGSDRTALSRPVFSITTTNTCGVTAVVVGCGESVGRATADEEGDDVGLNSPYGVDRGSPLLPQATIAVTIAKAANVARVCELRITSR